MHSPRRNAPAARSQVPVLKSSPSSLVERLGVSVEPLIVFAEETVLHEGHHGDTLLIVNSGIIEISTLRTRHLYRSVTDGCYFGDVAVLLNTKRTATCKAKMQSTLYTLTGTTLRETLLDYPEVGFERWRRAGFIRMIVCLSHDKATVIRCTTTPRSVVEMTCRVRSGSLLQLPSNQPPRALLGDDDYPRSATT